MIGKLCARDFKYDRQMSSLRCQILAWLERSITENEH